MCLQEARKGFSAQERQNPLHRRVAAIWEGECHVTIVYLPVHLLQPISPAPLRESVFHENTNPTCRVHCSIGRGDAHVVAQQVLSEDRDASWTVLVYMNGDNNLEAAGIDDFLEMAQVGSSSDLNAVSYTHLTLPTN